MGQESDQLIYQSLDDGGLAPIDRENVMQQRQSFAANDEAMDPDAKATKEEIERTRERMSGTLEAISERLDPRTLTQQAKDAVRDATIGKVENAAKTAGGTAKEALSTAGENISGVAHTAGATAKEALTVAAENISGVAHKVKDTVVSVGTHGEADSQADRAGYPYSEQSTMTDGGMGTRISGWGRQAQNGFRQGLEKKPLVMGAALVGLGALIGFVLPETDQENRLLGRIGSRAFSGRRSLGSNQVDQLPKSGITP